MTTFGQQLKSWRATRRLSQLDLASEAAVSSRHISFLESGRSRPSQPMVMHLCDVLDIPKGQRNILLQSAGFAPFYTRSELDEEHMTSVKDAMSRLLVQHDPYPAIILDQLWTIVDLNRSATMLFGLAGLSEGDSLLIWLEDTSRAAAVIENWAEVGHHSMVRLRNESRALGGVAELDAAAERLSKDPHVKSFQPVSALAPVLSTIYTAGGLRLPLFSTYASFGGADDLTVSELKIELMFPATPEADTLLNTL
ncbi:MAG: helix-turn-helix domain-containing protein [Pseudomonadota bacterium]